jgi:hypothetical protein
VSARSVRVGAPPARRRWELTPFGKVRLAGEILAAYIRVRYLLIRLPDFPEALDRLRAHPHSPKEHEGRSQLEAGVGLANAVSRTLAVLPTDSRCLMRSLVLVVVLARRGIASQLVIGVKGGGTDFAAHAWVEYDGLALLPPGDEFARLAEL